MRYFQPIFVGLAFAIAGCGAAPDEEAAGEEDTETIAEASVLPGVPDLAFDHDRFPFQGQWQQGDCNTWPAVATESVPNNAWPSGMACPEALLHGTRALMPESGCGGNQFQCKTFGNFDTYSVWIYFISLRFGGMYQYDDCSAAGDVGNPIFGGATDCPPGYFTDAIGRVKHPETNCGGWQYSCAARPNEFTDNPLYDRVRWAGQFQIDDCGTNTRSNPLTGAANCPPGYQANRYGRVKGAEGAQCGVNQYVCLGLDPSP